MLAYLIGLLLLIAIVGSIMNNHSNRRPYRRDDNYRNYRRRPTRHRRDYDDYYDDDDRDDYYDDDRRRDYHRRDRHDRGYYRRDRRHHDADYWGTFMGLVFLALVGIGIYWYNHTDTGMQSKEAKIEMAPDHRYRDSILDHDQTKESRNIPDDYDDYSERVDDYD